MDLQILKEVKEPIFFIANDVNWAIGLEKILPNYHIICLDDHPLVDLLIENNVSVFCLEKIIGEKNFLRRTSGRVLEHQLTIDFIKQKSGKNKPKIIFVKPDKKIEKIAQENNFDLIGNPSKLNEEFENKINFFKKYQTQIPFFTAGEIISSEKMEFNKLSEKYGLPFVVQSGIGWAGKSTYFIFKSEDLDKIRFIKREMRVNKYIRGITVLNNAVVLKETTLFSPPALQIKPEGALTSMPGGTGGRQWPVKLTEKQNNKISEITLITGSVLRNAGYRGFFGLDFLVEEKGGEVYLSECNARLTASVPFYTKLQLLSGDFPLLGYHLLSFLSEKFVSGKDFFNPRLVTGSEIIARNTEDKKIKIKSSIRPGIYGKNFEFMKSSLSIEEDTLIDRIWVTAPATGKIVNPEIEILRIDSRSEVCLNSGELNDENQGLVRTALSKISRENVE